jgi:glycosyltransferase involved in cell wall biosynthesis
VLALVGSGEIGPQLERAATELRVAERVLFPGRVSDAELLDWYRAADLFVLPTVAYEGFGLATVEALASGTPVVGTAAGATPELLEPLEPRLVARDSEPDSLAAAIADALAFSDAGFGARCREYAIARFDWDEVTRLWEEQLIEVATSERLSGP